MDDSVTEAAPAKINLALHVTDRRDNGYHDLESLIVFADISDELEARPAEADSLTISGPSVAG
jgi:4-diphosphocytidyl-2-C-methyl-D-erythritol kinase